MIAPMHGDRDRVGFLCGSKTKGDGKHDGVAVRNDSGLHRFLGVMAVGNVDIVSQRRAGEMAADIFDVDDLVGHAEPLGAGRAKSSSLRCRCP